MMKMRKLMGKGGFTLVEIMIVVAIIGLLAAIAIPNFIRARQRAQQNACIANLKQYDGAKTLWALDQGKTGTDTPNLSDLITNYIKATPACPTGDEDSYNLNNMNTQPTCDNSGSGHVLP